MNVLWLGQRLAEILLAKPVRTAGVFQWSESWVLLFNGGLRNQSVFQLNALIVHQVAAGNRVVAEQFKTGLVHGQALLQALDHPPERPTEMVDDQLGWIVANLLSAFVLFEQILEIHCALGQFVQFQAGSAKVEALYKVDTGINGNHGLIPGFHSFQQHQAARLMQQGYHAVQYLPGAAIFGCPGQQGTVQLDDVR